MDCGAASGPADIMAETNISIFYLSFPASAAQLVRDFINLSQTGDGNRVALGFQASRGIYRQTAVQINNSFPYQFRPLADRHKS